MVTGTLIRVRDHTNRQFMTCATSETNHHLWRKSSQWVVVSRLPNKCREPISHLTSIEQDRNRSHSLKISIWVIKERSRDRDPSQAGSDQILLEDANKTLGNNSDSRPISSSQEPKCRNRPKKCLMI